MDTSSPRVRMSVLGVVVLGCFVALTARLWYLQVMEAPELTLEATANITRTVAVEAPRGRILDVNGKVLVDNRTSLVVTVNRRTLGELDDDGARDEFVARLAGALTNIGGTPTKIDTLERRIADVRYDPIQPVPVAADVSEELEIYLAEHSEDFPGVEVRRETVRVYPYGAVGANILGYVGRIGAEALATATPGIDPDTGVEKTYQPNSNIGVAGVEATYEDDLRGTPGIEVIEVDKNNRPIRTVSRQDPKPGSDLQLNIDIDVQRAAEQSLVDRLDYWRGRRQSANGQTGPVRKAPAGAVAVVDPADGGVVALATFPSYDPAEFVKPITDERYAQLSDVNGVSALIDRSISGQYAPGSTFKLVTAEAALSKGYISAGQWFNDPGVFEVGNPPQPFSNAGGARYGTVNMARALTVSVDTYFYSLGARMDGTTDLQDAAAQFGFDKATGIDLPGESTGYVLTPADKAALHDKFPEAYPYREWFTGDNVQGAIGQNIVAVTPLQLANAYATLANGGTVYQPHVAWRVLRPGTDEAELADPASVVRVIEPVVKSQLDFPPEVRDPIVEGLSRVTTDPRGTGAVAFSGFDQRAFPILGKTGTAQVTDERGNLKADTSLFASYGPVSDPRYAVAAVMEETGFGGEGSGVVVCNVYRQLAGQQDRSCNTGAVTTTGRD
jgi:penicillin-binding protein 2